MRPVALLPLLLAVPAPLAHAQEAPKPLVDVSGYVQLQLNQSFDSNDDGTVAHNTFLIRRLRLRFKGQLLAGLGYVAMIDPSTPGNLLRDGYVSLTFVPHHELRIGQQKTQFGYDNPESSTRLLTLDRAFVSDALSRGPDLRDIGVGLFGSWRLPEGVGLDYELTLVNGAGPNLVQDTTARKSFWGRVGASYASGDVVARLGGSAAAGDLVQKATAPATVDVIYDFARFGVDLEVITPWIFVAAELVQGKNDLPTGTVDARGFYATAVGKTPWGAGALFRFDELDPDLDLPGDRLRRYTVGAFYDLVPVRARLVANVEIDASQAARDSRFLLWAQVIFP